MTIPFKNIPPNIRVPLFYAEISNSQANTGAYTQRALIIGQTLVTGSAIAGVPVISSGPGDGVAKGGIGSMLDLMMRAYGGNDSFGETYFLPLADDPAATPATGSILFTGVTTLAGAYSLYVAGLLVTAPVPIGTLAAAAATAVAAAINGGVGVGPDGLRWNLPVTATAALGVVTITARNAGLVGNDIDLRFNVLGAPNAEALPLGITAVVTPMAGGATNPSLTTGLAALVDLPFDFIVSPYTDAASMAAISTLLNDTTGRWSWETQIYGHAFMATRGTYGALTTLGASLNDQHASIVGVYDSPSWTPCWAAAIAGASAVALRADPAAPLQTVPVAGVRPPPIQSRFSLSQRNTLLYDGISTYSVHRGAISIENLITTYQINRFGQPDDSYLEVETMFTLMAVLRALSSAITSNFSRVKLAANGTPTPSGSNLVTPNTVRAYLIAEYNTLQAAGLVQGASFFSANVIVQQNAVNPNRLDVLWPGVLIDQLRVVALLAQFRLITPATGSAGVAAATLSV